MGNCLSKVPEGYLEYYTREVKSGNYPAIPSFQDFQALAGRTDFNNRNRAIVTPISVRFPACACDLEYSLSANKFVYENVKKKFMQVGGLKKIE